MIGVVLMNRSCLVVGSLFLASICIAQKGDSFDKHVADYRLLMSKKVQAEVGITVAQRTALNKAADDERKIAQPYMEQLQREGKDASVLRNDQKYLGFLMELRENILKQLTPSQLQRLRELTLQSVDIGGVMDVVVAKRIGMSVDQLTKVRKVYEDGINASSSIVKKVEQQVAQPFKDVHVKTQAEAKSLNDRLMKERSQALEKHKGEFDRIEKETKHKVESVLTAKQLAAYRALQGKTFNVKGTKS